MVKFREGEKAEMLKYAFITWAPFCSRSDNIAREFGGKSFMVYYSVFGSNYFSIAIKYLFQCIESFRILIREKPDITFVMNPPIFSCLPCWLYCTLLKKNGYITDSHTAAFIMKRWKLVNPLQKYFFKRAITNIVTNKSHAKIVKLWGAGYSIIGDIPVEYRTLKPYERMKEGFNLTIVNSFSVSEPVDIVLKAAEKVPDTNFYITGNLKHANKALLSNCPHNVIFTDFLPDEQYAWLIKKSDVVMTQCTGDNTMQRGAYEAMSFETPVITSDWGILRETFYKGTVFVENDVDSVIRGILEIKKNYERFKREIIELKKERFAIWSKNKKLLLNKIEK